MIVVLAELGGERLLGKARELADYQGVRVLAVCSEESKSQAQRYISLGADEVEIFPASNVSEWIEVFVNLVKSSKNLRMIILPSNVVGNLILGAVSARIPERIGSVLDGTEELSENSATKLIPLSECIIEVVPFSSSSSQEKVAILTLRLTAFPEPYEDTARYGKVLSGMVPTTMVQDRFYIPANLGNDSSDVLVILRSKSGTKSLLDVVNEVASKYRAVVLNEEDSAGKIVYGNCLAIDVNSHPRDLPQFNGDLVSINADKDAPITKLASLALVAQDVEGLLRSII
jgi:electron transfer flavoprotein alpha subunit